MLPQNLRRYQVFDEETQNYTKYKRFASQFIPENWVVMRGWKRYDDTRCRMEYFPENVRSYMAIAEDIDVLVGHNIKYDLLWEWESEDIKAFFKRGGRIWCTQYAEYLLEGQDQKAQMVAMDQIAEKYGGRTKVDAVKALWDAGYLTSEIDKDMLEDYLIGTEEEERNSGDVGNTELIFLGQVKRAVAAGMLPMILARMDGLCATTEMEFNGLRIDIEEAKRRKKILDAELTKVEAALEEFIPELPEGLEFNWGSPIHASALIFGGTIKYQKQAPYIDEKTGGLARYKAQESWPLFNGEPVNPANLAPCPEHYPTLVYPGQDLFVSGAKKGSPKFKKVDVPGEIKVKYQDFFFEMPGYTAPKPEWQTSRVDGAGEPVYQTNADVIDELSLRNIPFTQTLARRQDITKDLGTYYLKLDKKSGEYTGMLTCVMPGSFLIHHNLNHTNTKTTRLSSNNPNLQNTPRGDTSEVKKMFISRFLNGVMIEADYSQLEVVVLGLLSKDKNLIIDLQNRVDFHCKRVAAWKGCTYDEAKKWCKDDTDPKYPEWKIYRTNAKVFSFQRAYGAGAAKIAAYTGMPQEDVEALIEAEDKMYPGVVHYNQAVEQEVIRSATKFFDSTVGKVYRRGIYRAPTGTRYTFRSYDALDWQRKKGIQDSFLPTELKNYPVQGTGGEIVQIIIGKLWRHFVSNDNYGGKALLCNTVHDCVWADAQQDISHQVCVDMKKIMESVPETLKALYGMSCPVPFPVEVEVGKSLFDKQVVHI